MTASTGLVLALGVLSLLLGCVLSHFEWARADSWRTETTAAWVPTLAQDRSRELRESGP